MLQNRDIPQLREHTYELSYNSACQLVGRKQYTDAEKKLKVSEKLCRESLEDDGTGEEEIEGELGIIKYVICNYSALDHNASLKISMVPYYILFCFMIYMTVVRLQLCESVLSKTFTHFIKLIVH